MRKILFFPVLMMALFVSLFSLAQPTVQILQGNSSGYNPCLVPQNIPFFVYGNTTGYLSTDSITINVNFGDGSDTTFKRPSYGTAFYSQLVHLYTYPGNYSCVYMATGPDGTADTLIVIDQIILSMTCGTIVGTIYVDTNSNCVVDAGDALLHGVQLKLMKNGILHAITSSDTNGVYSFNVPPGFTYDVVVDTNYLPGYDLTCPLSGIYPNVSVPDSNLNFGFICNNPGFDLTGYLNGAGFRPNFDAHFWINVHNHGCSPQSGQIKLLIDPLLTFVSSIPAPFAVIGDTVIWNFSNLGSLQYFSAYVTVHTSPLAIVGDSVDGTLFMLPIAGDINPIDNVIHKRFRIVNSYDPNEKTVSPAGIGVEGYIPPMTRLDYTIFFQNTGTDVAYNIYIMDTLDSDIDTYTFQMQSSSHSVEVFMMGGNILKFNFANIMLPDSGMSLSGSQGYVTYTIYPKNLLAEATEIINKAYIYFDYNPAIATNPVLNTISLTVGNEEISANSPVIVYPNPMHSQTIFQIQGKGKFDFAVFDLTGKQVKEMNNIEGSRFQFDREGLPNGVFYYRLTDKKNNIVASGKLVIL